MMHRPHFYHAGDDSYGEWWDQRPKRAYRSLGPFRIVSTIMVAVALGIVIFGLICALMFLADVAEEHPSRARWVLRTLVVVNAVVHTSILLVDQMSWWRSAWSLAVNALYWVLLRHFPFLPSLSHPLVLSTVVAVLVESALWYWLSVQLMYYTPVTILVGFFLLLWLVPIGLLSSCVLEDDRLPGGGVGGTAMYDSGRFSLDPGAGGRKKRTVFNRLADLLRGS